jgi:putative endonuclease
MTIKPTTAWYVYMLRCNDGSLYTGITTNLSRRLTEHNSTSKGAKYTRARRPLQMVYHETVASRSAAAKREYQLKRMSALHKRSLVQQFKPEAAQFDREINMIDKATALSTILTKTKKMSMSSRLELLTYKKDRSVTISKMSEDEFKIIEQGFEVTELSVNTTKLKKALKIILKREFPRSNKIWLRQKS